MLILHIRQHIFGIIVYSTIIHIVKCSFTIYLSYLSSYNFKVTISSIPSFIFLSLNSFGHLFTSFGLLCNRYFITFCNQFLYIFFQMTLMKSNHSLRLSWWYNHIQNFRTYDRILKVDNKPFSPSIEYYLVKVLALYFPIPLHTWCHLLNILIWDVQS